MAGSYAGAYGAGAASDELHRLLAERLTNQKFDEEKRQSKAREEGEASDRRSRDTYAKQEADARASREEADRQRHYESRVDDRSKFEMTQKARAVERADDAAAGLEGEDRADRRAREGRDFTAGENEKNRQTQLNVVREAGRGRSEATPKRRMVSWYDKQAGQNRQAMLTDEEAAAMGVLDPAIKGAGGMKEKLADLFEVERIAKDIKARGEKTKWRGVGPLAGRIVGIGTETGMVNDPETSRLHADIANLFSMISHERFGGALTPGEIGRARGFNVERTMPTAKLLANLDGLMEMAESKRRNMGGGAMDMPGGDTAGPAPGTRRIINGQDAEWDGQAWYAVVPTPAQPPPGAEALFSSRMRP